MKTIIKVEEYLRTHKTPVTAKELATRFAVSKATVLSALGQLQGENVAKRTKLGNKAYWQFSGVETHMAVPTRTTGDTPRAAMHPANFRTSYPNIRGYED